MSDERKLIAANVRGYRRVARRYDRLHGARLCIATSEYRGDLDSAAIAASVRRLRPPFWTLRRALTREPVRLANIEALARCS